MSQKQLGVVQLEWVCPNCGSRNPGPEKKCQGCGRPQPQDVEFVQPVAQELITDAATVAEATRGPDIHCPFCGARNRADAEACRNCGGPLAGGAQRQAGQVVGAFADGPVPQVNCPACGTANPGGARRCARCGAGLVPGNELEKQTPTPSAAAAAPGCSRTMIVIGIGIAVAVLVLLYLATRTTATVGVVRDVTWQRTVTVESLVPVRKENWLTEIPAGVPVGQCRSKVVSVQDEPAPNSVEVCGTPYTIDQGTGFGQVVQDCEYQVYAEWCQFTVEEWKAVDTVVAGGEGFVASEWPALALTDKQRAGNRGEKYTVVFETDGATYEYEVKDPALAAQFAEGSRWSLEINTFGALTDVAPAR